MRDSNNFARRVRVVAAFDSPVSFLSLSLSLFLLLVSVVPNFSKRFGGGELISHGSKTALLAGLVLSATVIYTVK